MPPDSRRNHNNAVWTTVEVMKGVRALFPGREEEPFFVAWYAGFDTKWGSRAGRIVWDVSNWDDSNAAEWNPPPGASVSYRDAPPKPTFEQLVTALVDKIERSAELARKLRALKVEGSRRITAAYGAESWEDEVQRRLRRAHTPQQDAERERLRAAYAALRDWLLSPERTGAELAGFEPATDALWEAF